MKKLTSLLLAVSMLVGMMAVPAMAAEDVKVYLFGEKLEFDVPAQIVNGRTLVPVRKIFEELGYKVDWDKDTRTATAVSTERTIRITIDELVMYVNDEPKELDVPACIIDGRTLVPARAISEASGYKVDWDGDTRSVLITKPEANNPTTTQPAEAPSTLGKTPFEILRDTVVAGKSSGSRYYVLGDIVYWPNGADGECFAIKVSEPVDGAKAVMELRIYPEKKNPFVWFSYIYNNNTMIGLTADYVDGKYAETTNSFPDEMYGEAIDRLNLILENCVEKSIKEACGLSLADFGITY